MIEKHVSCIETLDSTVVVKVVAAVVVVAAAIVLYRGNWCSNELETAASQCGKARAISECVNIDMHDSYLKCSLLTNLL